MNERLDQLHPYPFEKLNRLLENTPTPDTHPIALSLGEPKHPAPDFIVDAYAETSSIRKSFGTYPPTKGLPELRQAIAAFVTRRFKLDADIDPESQVLPVTGTREALFAFAQTIINGSDTTKNSLTMMPNPFYQIYEGAALLAGSTPRYLNCNAANNFKPDFSSVSDDEWRQCQLIYICTPGNPGGATMSLDELQYLIRKSDQFDFVIASDECYSEIYRDEACPPNGLLEAAARMGRTDFKNCVSFNSLSKRSNLPGLRSGYACGDASILKKFLLYRTYHGSAMSVHNQWASTAAWNDEAHVVANRVLYREKFDAFSEILEDCWPMIIPDASFYLWPETPYDDQAFTQRLLSETNIKVLPGSYLSRTQDGTNPGANRVRMALVATIDECIDAANRIKSAWNSIRLEK
ncbi:MAG: succinyldiaminopimelate transaminase [Pseudomonadales bacterium]